MSQKDVSIYLSHALMCVEHIIDYTSDGEAFFYTDKKTQDAVIRNLEVIGQCIKDEGITALQRAEPQTDWRAIAAFRNVLAHEYLGVNPKLVWAIVSDELPRLERTLKALISL